MYVGKSKNRKYVVRYVKIADLNVDIVHIEVKWLNRDTKHYMDNHLQSLGHPSGRTYLKE